MERAEFLKMCQRCSLYDDGIGGIKINMPEELYVYYCGVKYYPLGYIMRFDRKGNVINNSLLHDSKTNSVIECNLDKVEVVSNGKSKV